jgi:hypothetical protein
MTDIYNKDEGQQKKVWQDSETGDSPLPAYISV